MGVRRLWGGVARSLSRSRSLAYLIGGRVLERHHLLLGHPRQVVCELGLVRRRMK